MIIIIMMMIIMIIIESENAKMELLIEAKVFCLARNFL